MKTIFNILWLIFFGWWNGLVLILLGALFGITIIGIPIAKALFQFATLHAMPFGKEIKRSKDVYSQVSAFRRIGATIMNILWFPFGLINMILYFIMAIISFVSIIGIPVGIVYMKMSKFILFPIGAVVVEK